MIITRGAVVGVDDAVASLITFGADAMVGTVGVPASSTVSAGRCHDALIHVLVAESASVTNGAGARKVEEVGRR